MMKDNKPTADYGCRPTQAITCSTHGPDHVWTADCASEPEQPTRIIGCPQCADTGKNVVGFRCRACELEQPTKRCIHGNPVGFGKCIECRDHMARLQDKTTSPTAGICRHGHFYRDCITCHRADATRHERARIVGEARSLPSAGPDEMVRLADVLAVIGGEDDCVEYRPGMIREGDDA